MTERELRHSEGETTLTGGSALPDADKHVTTRVGDQGRTSLGAHGFVSKGDWRIELLGGLDLLKTTAHTLQHVPEWFDEMFTDMMVALVKSSETNHDTRINAMESEIERLRKTVEFTTSGWYVPTEDAARNWDIFRVRVREIERIAWRVYDENEKKQRFKELAQILNRLSDFAFMRVMAISQHKI